MEAFNMVFPSRCVCFTFCAGGEVVCVCLWMCVCMWVCTWCMVTEEPKRQCCREASWQLKQWAFVRPLFRTCCFLNGWATVLHFHSLTGSSWHTLSHLIWWGIRGGKDHWWEMGLIIRCCGRIDSFFYMGTEIFTPFPWIKVKVNDNFCGRQNAQDKEKILFKLLH